MKFQPNSSHSQLVKQSSTMNSLSNGASGDATPKRTPVPFPLPTSGSGRRRGVEMVNRVLYSLEEAGGWEPLLPSNLCICSSGDLPWTETVMGSDVEKVDGGLLLLDCPSQQEVKTVLQALVGRVQKL